MKLLRKRPDHFDYTAVRTCKNCHTEFSGRFCNRCGQKVLEQKDWALLNFLTSVLNAFTFLDGKFINSIRAVLFFPGKMSKDISEGIQVPYMPMLSFFFVANFFYFFFPVFDAFNSSLWTQMHYLGSHSAHVKVVVEDYVQERNLTMDDFSNIYNNHSLNLSKILIILLTVMFASASMIINFSRKNFYLYKHMLFSLETYSFQILVNLVVLANLAKIIVLTGRDFGVELGIILSDEFFTITTTFLMVYFLYKAERTFFGQKWYGASIKAVLLIVANYYIVYFYRMMLFYVTMWTL